MSRNLIFKKTIAIILIMLFSVDSFAAVVSDNDGSAFITKAEFEALKKDFDDQIESYKNSLDSKIDGAIAAYLAGINLSTEGSFIPNIKNLDSVKWRDKLIKIGTARRWTAARTYSDTDNYRWEATYDTVLKCGSNTNPTSAADTDKAEIIWVVNNPYGHGGWILSMKAEFDGLGYWKRGRWGTANWNYNVPNYPMIRYRKDPYAEGFENQQKIVGWYDYGTNFSNAVSSENDASDPPGDATYLRAPTDGGKPSTLFNHKYAADRGAGRDTNCWGIGSASTAAGALTSNVGWRPTKASTIFFCPGENPNGNNRLCTTCDGYATLPTGKYFPLVSEDENMGRVIDDQLHTLMLGSDNEQEVNYYVERTDVFFWDTRPEWPEDCYKNFTLKNIVLRKVGINEQPNEAASSGGSWTGDRQEDTMTVTGSPYTGAFGYLGVPTTLACSLPTKPHKKLKLLDSNYVDYEGKRFLKFGEGIRLTDYCPDNVNVILQFDVNTNSEFASRGLKATIELCDKSFDDTTGATYYNIDEGATRLSAGSHKWVIDTTKTNKIQFFAQKGKAIYMRFSPNDNNGLNYVNITNLKANYISE